MKISYAITVCNEFVEIQKLIPFLLKNKRPEDEIVILYDENNGDPEIEEYLKINSINGEFNWYKDKFENHFADWKNKLTGLCSGDYIYQIDADEMVNEYILRLLPQILQYNDVDVVLVPRINKVEGLTQQHIDQWRWLVDEKGRINFPDYQWRIYRNTPEIKWKNKVHEVLDGYKTLSRLPDDDEFCLLHYKTIERQEKQNNYYNIL
jgi:hypothetical protein